MVQKQEPVPKEILEAYDKTQESFVDHALRVLDEIELKEKLTRKETLA